MLRIVLRIIDKLEMRIVQLEELVDFQGVKDDRIEDRIDDVIKKLQAENIITHYKIPEKENSCDL